MQTEVEVALLQPDGRQERQEGRRRQEDHSSVMKKYTKLLLGVVAALSSLAFVVYKFRYDRLYHVMQVLEVFGEPGQEGGPSCGAGQLLSLPTAWQEAGPGLHLYSAWCEGGDCGAVSLVGAWLGDNNTQSASLCSLWYEGAPRPLPGLLTPAPGPGVYTASCQSQHPGRVPHAVSLHGPAGPGYQLPVQPGLSNTTSAAGLGLCLLPGEGDLTRPVQDWAAWHALVGAGLVAARLYSPALSRPALAALTSLQQAGSLQTSLSVWNAPSGLRSDGAEAVAGRDCHQASRAASLPLYIVLSARQLLVPLQTDTLGETISLLRHKRLLDPGPNPVPVRRFCSEFPSSPQSGNLAVPALDQVQYSSQLSQDRTVQLVSLEPSQGQGQGQGQDLGQYLSVHDYSDCKSMSEEEGVTETRAQQFSAKLVSLYRKHNIRTS